MGNTPNWNLCGDHFKNYPNRDYAEEITFKFTDFMTPSMFESFSKKFEYFPLQTSNGETYIDQYFAIKDEELNNTKRTIYIGEWKNGKPEGKGIMFFPRKVIFQGQFSKGEISGFGRKILSNGVTYEGQFTKEKLNGNGSVIFISKDTKSSIQSYEESYIGNFTNNKFDGFGIYTWADGRVYKGNWKEGKLNGSGTLKYKDGTEFIGEFLNDVKNGKGCLMNPNGTKIVGFWENGHKKGTFIKTTTNGDIQELEYSEFSKTNLSITDRMSLGSHDRLSI